MTRPAPTVSVPREPTEAMLDAPDEAGVGLYSREVFAKIYRAMLSAAPAPLSLAGGEVHDAISLEVRMAMQDEMMASDANGGRVLQRIERANRAADAILAALSPEAPAREVRDRVIEVLKRIDDGIYPSLDDQADAIFATLTPRHEAPAEGAGERVFGIATATRHPSTRANSGCTTAPTFTPL